MLGSPVANPEILKKDAEGGGSRHFNSFIANENNELYTRVLLLDTVTCWKKLKANGVKGLAAHAALEIGWIRHFVSALMLSYGDL